MNLKYITALAFGSLTLSANADELTMQQSVPYGKGVVVSHAVRSQCKLQTKIPHYIKLYAMKRGIRVHLAHHNMHRVKGRKLLITIVHASSRGGGAWSGRKSVTISGTLKQGHRTIARFTAGRHTGGGMFGGYKGTCSLLGRSAKRIGKDVALWLTHPRNGSHLGNITPDQRQRVH